MNTYICICSLLIVILSSCVFANEFLIPCRPSTSCESCLLDPRCGWCGTYSNCVQGNSTGSLVGECPKWDFFDCPTPTPTPRPTPTATPPPSTVGSWPMYGGGPAHTGYVSGTPQSTKPSLRWNVTYPTAVHQVAAADGMVFVTSDTYFAKNVSLIVYDEQTGKKLWDYNFGEVFSINPPAFANNTVFVQRTDGSQNGLLFAFRATDGKWLWNAVYTAQWGHYLAPTVADGKVCVNAGTYGGLYCYDQLTGQRLFFVALPQYDRWTPSIANNRLFAWVNSIFYEFNMTNGIILWQNTIAGRSQAYSMYTTAVLDPPLAFVMNQGNDGNQLTALNVDTRKVLWNNTVQCTVELSATPAVANGLVFLPCGSTFYVLDQITGNPIGSVPVTRAINQPIVTNSEFFVPQQAGVTSFSRSDYKQNWMINSPNPKISYNGKSLFVAGSNGSLQVFAL